jgi:hypothetical protein
MPSLIHVMHLDYSLGSSNQRSTFNVNSDVGVDVFEKTGPKGACDALPGNLDISFVEQSRRVHPILNLLTKISRPSRCIIVTHKVNTYAGLFIRRVLIGRATDFHIENVFQVNYKIV